jgi:hypothetical protein
LTERTSVSEVSQLRLGMNHVPSRVEVVYKWCDKHMMTYRVKVDARTDKRRFGECPLCWREKNPRSKHRPAKQASGAGSRLVDGRIVSFSVAVHSSNP